MTPSELVEIVENLRRARTDSLHVEAKRADRDLPKRIWETLSAFANTHGGGVILLGIDEESGFAVTGVLNPRKVMQDLASLCDQMEPPIRAWIGVHHLEEKSLVVAEVPETEIGRKPSFYSGAGLSNGAFVRVGDGDRRLSAYEVQMMLASRGQPREDEEPVPEASANDLDEELVSGLLKRLREPQSSRFQQLDDERALQTLKVLVRHGDRWVPSLGGLLALGTYPQQFFSMLDVTFVVYPTPVIGEPGPRNERFMDNRRFGGPIPRIIRPLLATLERHLSRRAIVRGAYREDEWELPEAAVREALVNALVHRDLSSGARGTPVQVQLFPDRLRILNAGGLYGPISVDQLGEAGASTARNQVLMKLLEDSTVPEEGRLVCENRGSGIGVMLEAVHRAGLSAPQFTDRIAIFEVTFERASSAGPARRGGRRRTDWRREVPILLKVRGELTRAEIAEAFGVSEIAARKWLAELRGEGIVETTTANPRSPRVSYRLTAPDVQAERP